MAGKEGGGGRNDEWEERNVTPQGEQPIEVPREQWKFENRINAIPDKEWDDNPEKAYGKAVTGDIDE